MKIQDRQNGPPKSFCWTCFLHFSFKKSTVTNIEINGQRGVLRNSSSGLYQAHSLSYSFVSSNCYNLVCNIIIACCESGLTRKNWLATHLVSKLYYKFASERLIHIMEWNHTSCINVCKRERFPRHWDVIHFPNHIWKTPCSICRYLIGLQSMKKIWSKEKDWI